MNKIVLWISNEIFFLLQIGCCIWLLVATFFNLPVSGTHSIVGATVGFALVAQGSRGIQWIEFAKIGLSKLINWLIQIENYLLGASWFASPALAGIISVAVFFLIKKFILQQVRIFYQLKIQGHVLCFFSSLIN